MSSLEWPDLSSLVSLGRDQKLDVRPVLLRVHTDLFVAAPGRDRATIEAFEALALGFLPTVDDATAATVARKLAPITDTPRTIIDALIKRGGEVGDAIVAAGNHKVTHVEAPSPPPVLPMVERASKPDRRPAPDLTPVSVESVNLAVACDAQGSLGRAQLRDLVDRGREDGQLAMALLGRGDLSAADEAVLYLHADDARRTQIRARLEPVLALAGRGPLRPLADPADVAALLASARALDTSAFEAQVTSMLRLASAPAWRFQVEPRRELLALALVAAGVAPDDCIRIFLTMHPAISRSAKTVFHLAHIARGVGRPSAIHLVEAVLGVTIEAKREGQYVPAADPSTSPVRDRARRRTLAQIRADVLARRAG